MLQDRICRTEGCGKEFKGGPRAYYCHECRIERQRQQSIAYKSRKRLGNVREIGSLDKCERCGAEYEINSGMQRFCAECQPIHTVEYDRETSLPYYHENKDKINPIRNERRRLGTRNCDYCGKEHPISVGSPTTCSDECKRLLKNKKWNEKYGPAYVLRKKLKGTPPTHQD